LEEEKRSELARECREEMRSTRREGRIMSGGGKEEFLRRKRRIEEVEERGKDDGEWFRNLKKREKERQRKERWKRIRESKFCR